MAVRAARRARGTRPPVRGRDRGPHDPRHRARRRSGPPRGAVTLVRCKDTRARAVLLRTLGLRKEAATLRELSGALIGELGDKTAAHDLATALKRLVNEGEGDLAVEGVVVSALRSLAHLGGPEAVSSAVALAN